MINCRMMIVLDTNVVSELRRPNPNQKVYEWVSIQDSGKLYITTVTEAELRYGLELLPAGRRRRGLEEATNQMVDVYFDGRVLPFDKVAASAYAQIRASRRVTGRVIGELDCMIAAIARVNGAAVATRDTSGFEDCGVDIINPWEIQ